MKRRNFIKSTGGLIAAISAAPLTALASPVKPEPYGMEYAKDYGKDYVDNNHAWLPFENEVRGFTPIKGDIVKIEVVDGAHCEPGEGPVIDSYSHVTGWVKETFGACFSDDDGKKHVRMFALVSPIEKGISTKGWEFSRYITFQNSRYIAFQNAGYTRFEHQPRARGKKYANEVMNDYFKKNKKSRIKNNAV